MAQDAQKAVAVQSETSEMSDMMILSDGSIVRVTDGSMVVEEVQEPSPLGQFVYALLKAFGEVE